MLMRSYHLITFAEPWQVLKGTWRWTQFLVQGIIAVGGLVKHALGEKLLISMRLITSLRTLTEVTLRRAGKQKALKVMLFTCMEEEIKRDVKWNYLATPHTPPSLCSCPYLRPKWEPFLTGYGSVTFQNLFNVYSEFEDSRSLRNDSLKSWIRSNSSKVECFRILPDWHYIECSHLLLFIMESNSLWGPSWQK